MAGALRRRGGTAGYDSGRNSNERNSASYLSAERVHLRPVLRDYDFRRQLGERLEPSESPGKAHAGEPSARPPASDQDRLAHGRPDLLLHAEKHQSPVLPD